MTSANKTAWLDKGLFSQIVANTPLVSIDLIVRNEQGQVLLGQRLNRPAQGYWFVPGGRIRKDERLDAAFKRLTIEELGLALNLEQSKFLGIFEHFYQDNFSGEEFSTHYVVLGYEVCLRDLVLTLPKDQHSDYEWISVDSIIKDNNKVHDNTKLYFK